MFWTRLNKMTVSKECFVDDLIDLDSSDEEENDIYIPTMDHFITPTDSHFQRTPNIDILLVLFSPTVDVSIAMYGLSSATQLEIDQDILSKGPRVSGGPRVDKRSPPKRHPRRFPLPVTRVEAKTPKRHPNIRILRSARAIASARLMSGKYAPFNNSGCKEVSTRFSPTSHNLLSGCLENQEVLQPPLYETTRILSPAFFDKITCRTEDFASNFLKGAAGFGTSSQSFNFTL